jgi:hypothetical protein
MTNDDALIIERVKRWRDKLTPEQRTKASILTMSGKRFTPDQMLQEMENDTEMGKVFKAAEAKLLERTLQSKKAAGL